MALTDLLIMSLACWRISLMLTREDGPLDIFRSLRKYYAAGEFSPKTPDFTRWYPAEYDEFYARETVATQPFIGAVLSCSWCTSVWVAFFLFDLSYLAHPIYWLVTVVCAASAIAILINTVHEFLLSNSSKDYTDDAS